MILLLCANLDPVASPTYTPCPKEKLKDEGTRRLAREILGEWLAAKFAAKLPFPIQLWKRQD